MTTDGELLQRYANSRSEEAFAELVRRHVNLVYSSALRQVNGDAHLAQDVAQTVFADLARKAASLSRRAVLTGWLYTSTHFAAAKAVRSEQRRHAREQEAHTMRELLSQSPAQPDWTRLGPALDSVMHELKEVDREAILLRYFENRPLAEIGGRLGLTEDATRKRVDRALEKLRERLVRRGVTTTAAALSVAISTSAVQVAPAGLAAALTTASLATTAAGTGATLTLLKVMAMTKVQFGVTALVITGAAISLMVQHQSQTELREQNRLLKEQIAQLESDNETLSNRSVQAKSVLKLNLPAPRVQAQTRASESDLDATNLIARLQRGEKAPMLTPEQAEKYLNENHRSAASLLAAFRATGDQKALERGD